MEKRDYRFYIKVRNYLGEALSVIHQDLVAFARGKAITYSIALKWHKRFSENKMDIEDLPRSGRQLLPPRKLRLFGPPLNI